MTYPIREYTPDEELRELSFQYIIDAQQFATQATVLLDANSLVRNCEYHIGYLSKIAVTLYMSIECSLKSLICASHIGETPHSVYWKRIRPASHFFKKLKAEIPNFSALINSPSIEAAIDRLSEAEVSERYCLEISSESDLLGSFNIDSTKLTEEIEALRGIVDTALQLRQIAWDFRATAFDGHRTLPPHLVKAVLKKIKTK